MQYVMAALVGGGIGFLAFCLLAGPFDRLLARIRPQPATRPEAERRFRAVFSIMSEAARTSLLNYYIQKHGCSRLEAMSRAVEDRERDAGRW